MGIYTTFFLCDPAQLLAGFPSWQLPLPQPVRREFRNPVTRQITAYETREPSWPESAIAFPPQYRAVPISDPYENYLHERLSPFIRGRPHWATKGLTDIEIGPLLRVVGTAELQQPIYGPPSQGAIVQQLPADFIAKLKASDQNALAQQWASEMSTPQFTHSASGKKLSDGWTAMQAAQLLNPIATLAAQATAKQMMYLLIEA